MYIHNNDEITELALKAGTLILENGGETYRTEDTIVHVAQSMGAVEPSAFVTPTVIMLSFQNNEGKHSTVLRRIKKRTVNLQKIALANTFSRKINQKVLKQGDKSSLYVLRRLLSGIQHTKSYPLSVILFGVAMSAFVFAYMFNGNLADAFSALVIGTVFHIFVIVLKKIFANGFIVSLLYGGIISVLTECAQVLGFTDHPVIVLTAVLMQVVPGLAIVNAIRDIIAGDFVSGSARTLEAFMIATGLSIGSVAGIILFSRIQGLL